MGYLLDAGIGVIAIGIMLAAAIVIFLNYRVVVPTDEVHIVQKSKEVISYGKGQAAGNVYYEWPSWIPVIGLTTKVLPVSIFSIDISDYEAYDKGRLPFLVDIVGFFRISESNQAAERVSSFEELEEHLLSITQGAVRSVFAKEEIEVILEDRAKLGESFTLEVKEQLKNWGVESVKSIELRDIKDAPKSFVIHNLMQEKYSRIEKESRVHVAKNKQEAEQAEISSSKSIGLSKVDAEREVKLNEIESNKLVSIQQEENLQQVATKSQETAKAKAELLKIQEITSADIAKEKAIIDAKKSKEVEVLSAEAELEKEKKRAEAILEIGKANAESRKLDLSAPVEAQITLSKEIGQNKEYQEYLIAIENIKATIEIGKANAEALVKAKMNIYATSSSVSDGVKSIGDILSPAGGLKIASAIESLSDTKAGKAILETVGINTNNN